jgi:hypothetical protein
MKVYIDTLCLRQTRSLGRALFEPLLESVGKEVFCNVLDVRVTQPVILIKALEAAKHCQKLIVRMDSIDSYFGAINKGKYYYRARRAIRELRRKQLELHVYNSSLANYGRELTQFKFSPLVVELKPSSSVDLINVLEEHPYIDDLNFDVEPYLALQTSFESYMEQGMSKRIQYLDLCVLKAMAGESHAGVCCDAGLTSMTLWANGTITNCPRLHGLHNHSVVYKKARTQSQIQRAIQTVGSVSAWKDCPIRTMYKTARKNVFGV